MMKKWLSMLLALAMLMTTLPLALAEEAAAPQVGDVIHGFEVVEVGKFPLINADLTYFVHQKTGAALLYLANDDTNRVFDLTFRTPAESDMGVPHVFEHATLGGSEKYPSRDLFFNLSYQTYNTYMNAATYSHMTTYPVASLSEEQLYLYADYYTDSCFNPMIHQDEGIFTEEAWRYAMDSADSDLTIAGTVYSEMQGSYTIDSAAYQFYLDVMFPGSNASHASGGVPSEIPNMTWKDVTDYHTNYYHPSNSMAFLYGSFENYERFLQLLDGYYAAYEKKDIVIADAGYTPIAEAQAQTFQFPMEASSATDKQARIFYGFRLDGLDEATLNSIDLLVTLLGSPSFPVIQKLKEMLPTATVGCSLTLDTPVPTIVFTATGVDEADAPVFRDAISAGMQEILEKGFDKDAVDAIIAAFNMDIKLITESSTLGVDMIPNIAYYWASTGDWKGYMDYIAYLDNFASLAEDGTFVTLMDKYLVQNAVTAMVVTVPAPGMKEQQDAALAEKLAGIKAEMTEDEIAAIVESTAALSQQGESTAAEYVRQLQAVTVASLPEELRVYDYTDVTGEDGVRRIDVAANVDGVGQAMVLLNASSIPQDGLHWFQLYTDLLCEVDTTKHDRAQLSALATRYLYDGVIKVSMPYEGKTDLYLRAAWIAADEDMQAAYDFVYELLFETQFTDAQRVKELVSAKKNNLKNSITQGVYQSQLSRAQSIASESTRLYTYMTDIDYYLFLEQVEALMDQQPEAALMMLQAIQAMLNNSTGAISAFAGTAEGAANHRAAADAFLASLSKQEIVPAAYNIPAPARAEGIIIDSSVQYNLTFATWAELGLADYTGDLDAVTALVNDTFLLPLLRDQYGVYSVLHGASADGIYLLTYRDPNVQETYDVYAQLPELLKTYTADQETLDGYILSAYAYYATSTGELSGAATAIFNVIDGKAQDENLAHMKALKALKAKDLAKYVDAYTALVTTGARSTAGGAGAIEGNAALFEATLNPFGAVDPTSVAFEDCGEDHPLYAAVRFAFENGLMAPIADTTFGADEQATLGDYAAACYVLLGGTLSPDEALAYLGQFGLVPADAAADMPLTRSDMLACMVNFMAAVGMPVSGAELPAFDDAADVEEGMAPYFGWAVQNGLMQPATETTLAPNAPATRADLALLLCAFQ